MEMYPKRVVRNILQSLACTRVSILEYALLAERIGTVKHWREGLGLVPGWSDIKAA